MTDVKLDLHTLRSEVGKIISEYSPSQHSRADHHDGGWGAIGLIAHEGNPHEDRILLPLRKTPALALAPYLERVIDSIPTKKGRVRLMALNPEKSIYWHYDKRQTVDGRHSARLHIPIFTNKDIRVQLSHEDLVWKAGEIWYGDFSFPHRLYNGSQENRVHLVMDFELNDYVYLIFPSEFLAESKKRLGVKKACQHMLDLYAIGRLPSGERLPEFINILNEMVGKKSRPKQFQHM